MKAKLDPDKPVRLVKGTTCAVSISRPGSDVDGSGFAVRTGSDDFCEPDRFFVSDQLNGAFQELAEGVGMYFEAHYQG